MSAPKVSVICAVRDGGELFEHTVASITAQTYLDWELLVADDGSTDATPDRVLEHAMNDPRIRLVARERVGRGCATEPGPRRGAGGVRRQHRR